MIEDQGRPPPLQPSALSRAVVRWLALVALVVVVIVAAVLFLDIVSSTGIVPFDDKFGRADPGVHIHLMLVGSNQLLDATPTLVFSPVNWWNVDVSANDLALGVNEYCVDDVFVASRAFEAGLSWRVYSGNLPKQIIDATSFNRTEKQFPIHECARIDNSSGSVPFGATYRNAQQNQDAFPIEWRSNNGASLFPFDAWHSVTAVYVLTTVDGTNARYATPDVSVTTFVNNWDISAQVLISNNDDPITQDETKLLLTARRPLSVRLFTLFLLLAVLALEVAIYFITDHNTAIGAVIGVIFGLWSIHELLVPPGMPAVNLVRSIILFLYVVLVVVAFLRFFAKPLLQTPGETIFSSEAPADDHRTD